MEKESTSRNLGASLYGDANQPTWLGSFGTGVLGRPLGRNMGDSLNFLAKTGGLDVERQEVWVPLVSFMLV